MELPELSWVPLTPLLPVGWAAQLGLPPAPPHQTPMDSQGITVEASSVLENAQVTHTPENFTALMCFKPIKSTGHLYSTAKDFLKFKHVCRAWLL